MHNLEMKTHWIVIILNDDVEPSGWLVESAFGPFATKKLAVKWMDEFNKEYDGSPWRAVMRPMTEPLTV